MSVLLSSRHTQLARISCIVDELVTIITTVHAPTGRGMIFMPLSEGVNYSKAICGLAASETTKKLQSSFFGLFPYVVVYDDSSWCFIAIHRESSVKYATSTRPATH